MQSTSTSPATTRHFVPSGRERRTGPMQRWSPVRLKRIVMLSDFAGFVVAFALTFWAQAMLRPVPTFVVRDHIILLVCSSPAFAAGAGLNHLYKARMNERPLQEAANVAKAVGVGTGGLLLMALAIQYEALSRFWVAFSAVSLWLVLVIERAVIRLALGRLRVAGGLQRRIVIVGTDAQAIALMHGFERNPGMGYRVVGFVGDDDFAGRAGVDALGRVEDLPEILRRVDAVGVVISLASVSEQDVNMLTRRLTDEGFHVTLASGLRDIDIRRLRPQILDSRTMIYVEPVIRTGWRAGAKRSFDIVVASVLLILTIPIHLITIAAIKLTSPGPVFFVQTRVGRDGQPFRVVKYRTMEIDAEDKRAGLAELNEADGPLFKIRHDPRVTSVGRWIRKLSIDELPQLGCVLRGTMSMVGPRPALPDEVEQWDSETRERLRVLPGITGLWQTSGRSDSSFETYKRMDLFYVDNWSLRHDVHICVRTIGAVLACRGAS